MVTHGGRHGKKFCVKMNGAIWQGSKRVLRSKQNLETVLLAGMRNGGRNTMQKDGQRKVPINMVGSMNSLGGKSGGNNMMAEELF